MRRLLWSLVALLLAFALGAEMARAGSDDDQDDEDQDIAVVYRAFGAYHLDIWDSVKHASLTIRREGKVVFERRAGPYPWGVAPGFSLDRRFKARLGSPFTDDRKAVVVRFVTHDIHCCDPALIFLLQPEFHFIEVPYAFWDVPDSPSMPATAADLLVLDPGPQPDGSMPGQIFCEVNLRLRGHALHVDADLQRRPPYSRRFLTALARRLHEFDQWGDGAHALTPQDNPQLEQFMMALIYTGNAAQARELMDRAWRDEIPDKQEWAAKFWADRKKSPYWPEIAALSTGARPAKGGERDDDFWPICYATGDQG
jgi:hypothetical protein